jgi:hypothetical protein
MLREGGRRARYREEWAERVTIREKVRMGEKGDQIAVPVDVVCRSLSWE